jgi:hypothetical protein
MSWVSYSVGRFSGVHVWPDLGVHRGHSPALAEIKPDANGHSANVFTLPARIDAHQTAAGWLVFSLGNNVLAGRTVDTYRIILEDSHGTSTTTEPILVKDWSDETAKN